MRNRTLFTIAMSILTSVALAGETFVANAVPVGEAGAQPQTTIRFVIDRWSSDETREKLIKTLAEEGSDAVREMMTKMKPVGQIVVPGQPGYPLRYARQTDDGVTRRIFLATERPMSFEEVARQPRSYEYKFMLAELDIDVNNEGEGVLMIGVRTDYNEKRKTIELEKYGTREIRLTSIHKAK